MACGMCCEERVSQDLMAMAPTEKLEEHAAPQPATVSLAKTPPRTRPARVSSLANVATTRSSPKVEDRTLAIEKELARVQKRADARGKEAGSLRQRVQELEPEIRRLANELEKRRQRDSSRSRSPPGRRKHPPPTSMAPSEGDVALRGRLAAAENRAKILQLRCDQLELERSSGLGPAKARPDAAAEHEDRSSSKSTHRETNTDDERHQVRDTDSEAKRIKRQLEVAERRVQNSLYINEAHESLATKATEREKEANARAAELGRRLDRALEKLESIERKDMITNLQASCTRDEEGIHLAQRELRAHQMDPDLYLPVNTAKRRQLARSEKSLQRLRLRHESQAAALRQAQVTEQSHSDLRRAAGLGDVQETAKCLESGISVNVPDQHGLSAFLYACGQGNPELIRMLIDAGGDVLDGDGTITGLIIAARKGSLEVVQTLLDAGANVDARDSAGGIALHAATLRRHVDVARVLLEAGSDCNAVDQGNNTPLHMLATPPTGNDGGCGSVAGDEGAGLVALLLEWGASADIKNSQGLTPKTAALDTKNRATVLAYRAFFGDDTGLAVGVDVEGGASGRVVANAVALPELQAPPMGGMGGAQGTEKAVSVAEPEQARKTVSA